MWIVLSNTIDPNAASSSSLRDCDYSLSLQPTTQRHRSFQQLRFPTPSLSFLYSMAQHHIQDLQNAPNNLWYRLHVYTFDLRLYRERVEAEARLEQILDASYIGSPYFQPHEAEMLKATIVDGVKTLSQVIEETLDERLNRRLKKREDSGDYRVCAAHDLAPIFETAFSINPKELARDESFVALTVSSGLTLKDGESWEGVKKPTGQPKNHHKRKKGKR